MPAYIAWASELTKETFWKAECPSVYMASDPYGSNGISRCHELCNSRSCPQSHICHFKCSHGCRIKIHVESVDLMYKRTILIGCRWGGSTAGAVRLLAGVINLLHFFPKASSHLLSQPNSAVYEPAQFLLATGLPSHRGCTLSMGSIATHLITLNQINLITHIFYFYCEINI